MQITAAGIAIVVNFAGLALGIFDARRAASISRLEKRTQLAVDALAAKRRVVLLDEELRLLEEEWGAALAVATSDDERQECETGREAARQQRTHTAELMATLLTIVDMFKVRPGDKWSQIDLEHVRRSYVELAAQADGTAESVAIARRRLEGMRKAAGR